MGDNQDRREAERLSDVRPQAAYDAKGSVNVLHEFPESSWYCAVRIDVRPRKCKTGSCQNCVRYPPKPLGNIAIYGDMRTHMSVARSR